MRNLLYSILAFFIMVGCSDVSSPDVNEPQPQLNAQQSASISGDVVNKVRASGKIITGLCNTNSGNDSDVSTSDNTVEPAPDPIVYPKCIKGYSLTAKEYANGEVKGKFSVSYETNSGLIAVDQYRGEVNCLRVEGNTAYIGGTITGKNEKGNVFWTKVKDGIDQASFPTTFITNSSCSEASEEYNELLDLQGNVTIK